LKTCDPALLAYLGLNQSFVLGDKQEHVEGQEAGAKVEQDQLRHTSA